MIDEQEARLGQHLTRLKVGKWTVAPALNQLEHDGKVAKLEPRAMDLLMYLAGARDRVVSADELLRELWKGRVFDDGVVHKKINQLRKALGDDPGAPVFIETIPKRGYRLIAAVEPVPRNGIDAASIAANGSDAALQAVVVTPQRRLMRSSAVLAIAVIAAFVLWRAFDEQAPPPGLGIVAATPPLTAYAGDERGPAWDPHGARVVFTWDAGTGRPTLHVTEIGSTAPMPLTAAHAAIERSPRWSPTEAKIAFLRQRTPTGFDLLVTSAFGGDERKLTEIEMPPLIPFDAGPFLTYTPDGERLLFTSVIETEPVERYSFQLLSLESQWLEPLVLGSDLDDYDTSPAFSPDGKRLAFVRYRLSQRLPQIMVQELGPGLKPLGAPAPVPGVPPGVPRWPAWAPEGTSLTFTLGQQIYEWQVGGELRVVHSIPLMISGLDMSWHDGRARGVISVAQANLDIWAVPLDPIAHVAVGSRTPRIHTSLLDRHAHFSPDGRQLAFVSAATGRGQLYVVDAAGGAWRQQTDLAVNILGYPRWSPDGGRIAFHTSSPNERNVIYTVAVDAGLPQRCCNGVVPSWSADGEHLYVTLVAVEGKNMIARVRIADGHSEILFAGNAAVETRDGRDLLYSKVGQPGIFARAIEGNPAANVERTLVEDARPEGFEIVPVETGFYYRVAGDSNAFQFYDYDKRTVHVVADAPPNTDLGLTVSPDGRELLYAAQAAGAGFDLKVLEFEPR
jgi:DNA-binding winged helix-turn-helix (wHTH) protein/Tol biopolymer transport system component